MSKEVVQFDFADEMDTRTRSEEGVWLPIKKLDGFTPLMARNGKPVRIKVLGPDSTVFRKLTRKMLRERMQAASAGKELEDNVDEEQANALTACTVDWENVLDREGNPVPATPEILKGFYRTHPGIADQVDQFINQRQNFTMASSKE
jgi:hypothetical protein